MLNLCFWLWFPCATVTRLRASLQFAFNSSWLVLFSRLFSQVRFLHLWWIICSATDWSVCYSEAFIERVSCFPFVYYVCVSRALTEEFKFNNWFKKTFLFLTNNFALVAISALVFLLDVVLVSSSPFIPLCLCFPFLIHSPYPCA